MTTSIINLVLFIALGVIGGVMTATSKLLGAALVVLATVMVARTISQILDIKVQDRDRNESIKFLIWSTVIASLMVMLATLFAMKITILWGVVIILATVLEAFGLAVFITCICGKKTTLANLITLALAAGLIAGAIIFASGWLMCSLIVIAIAAIAIVILKICGVKVNTTMIVAIAAIIITIPLLMKGCDSDKPSSGIVDSNDTTAVDTTTDVTPDTTMPDDTTAIFDENKHCPLVEHQWDAGVQDCDKIVYTCTNCGFQRIEDVPQTSAPDTTAPHTSAPDTTAPPETQAPDTTAPHTHSYVGKVTTSASCKSTGVKTYTCGCGSSYTETIPMVSHKYSETVVNAATEYEAGCKKFTCSGCGTSYTESIPKLAHNTHKFAFDKNLANATCGENGTAQYKCPCGATEKRTISATGDHSWDDGVITVSPTTYREGVRKHTCKVCDETKLVNIPKLEEDHEIECSHNYCKTVVEGPTAYEGGTVKYTCSYCNDSYTETTPAVALKLTASATQMVWCDTITIKTNGYAFNLVLVNDDIAKLEIIDENTIEVVLTNENAGGSLVVYDMIMPTTQVEIIILPNLG